MNKVVLLGRLTKDPDVRQTQNNVCVVNFNLAVNRRFKQEGQADADFINIVSWGKTAEFCSKYFVKGGEIEVPAGTVFNVVTTADCKVTGVAVPKK